MIMLFGVAAGVLGLWQQPQTEPRVSSPVRLTSPAQFAKAGEAYFSPDGRWIIFQAVPVPPQGQAPSPFYSMYVARLKRAENSAGVLGPVTGLEEPVLVSPEGSANTCGWFHPTEFGRVIFGSTVSPPKESERPGFQVGTNRYVWSFPPEMDIVQRLVEPVFEDQFARRAGELRARGAVLDRAAELDQSLHTLVNRPGYDAECSISADGRFILYANVDPAKGDGKPDADIWVRDSITGRDVPLVQAAGYDGGPFFSPDGAWICYRSDRKGDDKLQLFVAKLAMQDGVPTGIEREFQITRDEHVNWAPYWHPSGNALVYGSSAVGHRNYELFMIPVDRAALERGEEPAAPERVTFTEGADVLPVFSSDGRLLMWTSQRPGEPATGDASPARSSQLWVAQWQDTLPTPSAH